MQLSHLAVRLRQGSVHAFDSASPGMSQNDGMPPVLRAWPTTSEVTAPMRIELAGVEHLDVVLSLIEDARSWLWEKGTDQWAKPWPDPAARDERVLAGLRNGKTWIVWDGDIPAATVTITTRRNSAVWSKPACTCDLSERAVFVHRLITSRRYAGRGLGAELIAWAGLRGRREYGAKWIRIDVWTENKGLHGFYQNLGFQACGFCDDPDYPSGALFEKPVAGVGVPALPQFTESPTDMRCTAAAASATVGSLRSGNALTSVLR